MTAAPGGALPERVHPTPLPRVAGRAPRILSLVYRDPDHDSRVLKTAATLEEAGAEVLVVGLAPYTLDLPEGRDRTPEGVEVFRTRDLDLTRTFSTATRVWRRLTGRDPRTGAPQQRELPPPDAPAGPAASAGRAGTQLGARARAAYTDAFRVARLVRYWAGAVSVGRRYGADVVHANDGNTLVPALVLKAVQGAGIVYDSHELWLRRNIRPRPVAPYVEAAIEAVGIRAADAVVTVSSSIADWLQQHYGLADRPSLVRNIPVWGGRLPDPSSGRLRELAGLAAQDRVVSYCGGIAPGRGLEETIDALALLPDDVHLVMLGPGGEDYLAGLRARADARGVGERVHRAPAVPGHEVPSTLADADLAVVYVRPVCLSYVFSLPNKLFESIHAGLPIVAADLPDTAALVREHGLGEVFGAETAADLAAALARVLEDPGAHRDAVAALAPTLDWRREAERLVAAHAHALRSTGRRPAVGGSVP